MNCVRNYDTPKVFFLVIEGFENIDVSASDIRFLDDSLNLSWTVEQFLLHIFKNNFLRPEQSLPTAVTVDSVIHTKLNSTVKLSWLSCELREMLSSII